MSSKAEFVSPAAAASGDAVAAATGAGPLIRPAAQPRKSNRSRTSTFLTNALLRPRGKSVSHGSNDDWGRQVGGSEGLGSIYNSTMGSRERNQVLRSVTQLTKQSTNDLTGAAAEAFSGNATPGLSQNTRFFANVNSAGSIETPPTYEQDVQLERRRRSEGSITSSTSLAASSRPARPSMQSSRPSSYFSFGVTSAFSASATASGSTSISPSPGPRYQPPTPSKLQEAQRRRSSGQSSATTRLAVESSRSFLDLPSGISVHQPDAAAIANSGSSEHESRATAVDKSDSAQVADAVQQYHIGSLSGIDEPASKNPSALHSLATADQHPSDRRSIAIRESNEPLILHDRQNPVFASGGEQGFSTKCALVASPAVAAPAEHIQSTCAAALGGHSPEAPADASAKEADEQEAETSLPEEKTPAAASSSSSSGAAAESARANSERSEIAWSKNAATEHGIGRPIGKANPTQASHCLSDCRADLPRGDSAAPLFSNFSKSKQFPEQQRDGTQDAFPADRESAIWPSASASATEEGSEADALAAQVSRRLSRLPLSAATDNAVAAATNQDAVDRERHQEQQQQLASFSPPSASHNPDLASAASTLPSVAFQPAEPVSDVPSIDPLSHPSHCQLQYYSRSHPQPDTFLTSPSCGQSEGQCRQGQQLKQESADRAIGSVPARSTAQSISLKSASTAVFAEPNAAASSFSPPRAFDTSSLRQYDVGGRIGVAPPLSSTASFSTSSAHPPALSSTPNRSTSPSLTSGTTRADRTVPLDPLDADTDPHSPRTITVLAATRPSTDLIDVSSTPLRSQHAYGQVDKPLKEDRLAITQRGPSPVALADASDHRAPGPIPAVAHNPTTPLVTPPSSSGACPSRRSSSLSTEPALALAHDAIPLRQSRANLPSPPGSSTHGSVSESTVRRGSSIEPSLSLLSPLPSRSSAANASTSPDRQAAAPESAARTSNSGRVSFDLRKLSIFGGSSSATKMSPKSPRASFAGIGNGQPSGASNQNSSRHASSASPGPSSSKFFSRISLPGSSRRGSAADALSASSPESKPRSRFASFGKIGRGGDQQTSPKHSQGLRNSMQPWASASTDVLGTGSGQAPGRNSFALAREEATRPRKSLHLPRANLIDLDSEDTSDTAATTSTGVHGFNNTPLPPISTSQHKPVSPSLNSARRPSLNFLRRSSANSTGSNADNVNGERRSSFARAFMNRTWSRGSKGDQQQQPQQQQRQQRQEPSQIEQTARSEAEQPTFRNGIFDPQAGAFAGNVTYPGMASTVNWNAPTASRGPEQTDVPPNDVDPLATSVPSYPGSSAARDLAAPPKAVTDVASGVLAERRPSQGIDQEQDAAEASDTVAATLGNEGPATTSSSAPTNTNGNTPRQRSNRSRSALSHLPRLDSMRAIPGASSSQRDGTSTSSVARNRSESTTDSTTTGEASDEEQEVSEDEDEGDITGNTSDYHDLDEAETEDETDYDNSPIASRRVSTAPMASTGSSGGLNRNRPTESLVLPPAPVFIPTTDNSLASQSSNTSTSTSNDESDQHVGRDAWTSFRASGFTPFETPTPSVGGASSFASGFAGPTPRARQEVSDSSYFTARPGTSNSNRATTAGTMSGDAPPPSPSIISRSRAPSSASMRGLRTPGASSVSSGPVPNRSMPPPVGALPPLALRRQISTASGTSNLALDRSKSPGRAPGSSRPSTSGTLTPLQAPNGERAISREPSIDRPASERPASRQSQGQETRSTASPRAATKPLLGLDGTVPSAARPNFYQQKSKSLVDLLGPASRRLEIDTSSPTRPIINEPLNREALRTPTTPRPPSEAPAYSKKDSLAPISVGPAAPASIASPGGMSLGRRRSMFEMRAEPPEYSIIHNRPEGPQIILPREEEGREKLPTYYCGVHIEGYLPRKMEFSAPGVQAKDRSWRRQYFVLHGTSLRVYKNDLSVDRHAANGSWGEMKGVHVHLEPMNEDGSNGSGSGGINLGAAAREAISHTALGAHRHEASKNKEFATQFDTKNGLIRNYSLQSAESGLAADYLKRRHVVRVRAEGEQFLLQTRSDRHVVDWIEALQAATNVSMDLEKRAMPKFITLPRRRRRRRRNPDGTTANPEEQEARDLAEAQRRSMAEAGGRAADARTGDEPAPRASMSARPSMSMENEMNPSAAFERMLREDQEEGGRQTAAVM
ncbi:PH domain-containing protein [Pseudozyma hubeiensis]|nr:PH domain-containing protein [Pseudozyma hubeiensis]